MSDYSRKVVGQDVVITEHIKKEIKSKNVLRQTVIRETIKCLVLECGHKPLLTGFMAKAPKFNTHCRDCEHETSIAECEHDYKWLPNHARYELERRYRWWCSKCGHEDKETPPP